MTIKRDSTMWISRNGEELRCSALFTVYPANSEPQYYSNNRKGIVLATEGTTYAPLRIVHDYWDAYPLLRIVIENASVTFSAGIGNSTKVAVRPYIENLTDVSKPPSVGEPTWWYVVDVSIQSGLTYVYLKWMRKAYVANGFPSLGSNASK